MGKAYNSLKLPDVDPIKVSHLPRFKHADYSSSNSADIRLSFEFVDRKERKYSRNSSYFHDKHKRYLLRRHHLPKYLYHSFHRPRQARGDHRRVLQPVVGQHPKEVPERLRTLEETLRLCPHVRVPLSCDAHNPVHRCSLWPHRPDGVHCCNPVLCDAPLG